jgi:hypothetical protein
VYNSPQFLFAFELTLGVLWLLTPLHNVMNRLKQLAAILLNSAEDPEQAHAALEAAGVPVSFADCRNCPNPCEDGKPALSHFYLFFDSLDMAPQVTRSIRKE